MDTRVYTLTPDVPDETSDALVAAAAGPPWWRRPFDAVATLLLGLFMAIAVTATVVACWRMGAPLGGVAGAAFLLLISVTSLPIDTTEGR